MREQASFSGCDARKPLMLRPALVALAIVLTLTGSALLGPYEDGMQSFMRGDYANTLNLWLPLAERGDAAAQHGVGNLFNSGLGVPESLDQAVFWYQKAADQGYAEAQFDLWRLHYYQGDLHYYRDDGQAVFWYQKAAEQGHAEAQFALGLLYINGDGVSRDYARALFWFRRAAEQGHVNSYLLLGSMHKNGEGVVRNYAQAVYWYQKAADQRDFYGQSYLADMYLTGKGVPLDLVQARMWLNLAVACSKKREICWIHQADYDDAARKRADIGSKMTPAQIAEAQRLATAWKPK